MSEHPTDLELEMARTGEGETDVLGHLEECAECGDRASFLEGFAAAMSQPAPTLEVPEELDQAILGAIRQRGEFIRERKEASGVSTPGALKWILPVAAAASIVLALGLSRIAIESKETLPKGEIAVAPNDDVNGDGQVDIVDALVLARAVEAGTSVDRLKEADVDRIARAAVALNNRGSR